MCAHAIGDGTSWAPTWTQAMTSFRGEHDQPPFDDVTIRMKAPASIGGSAVRLELSNRFGVEPVLVGRGAIRIADRCLPIAFDGQPSIEIAAGASSWTDAIELTVEHGDEIVIDIYLPEPTPYITANGFSFDRSTPGDHVGSDDFPATAPEPDPELGGTGWSLPPGGPFLRTVEVAGAEVKAVIVCLGGSSTAMGWPQYASALLPADAGIAVVNRGIAGNRLRLDAPGQFSSWGRAGVSRFDEDVLATHAATHVAIAYNSNDWTLPGRITPRDEMPTRDQLIDGYRELAGRARDAGLAVILATVTPLGPELAADPLREGRRASVNTWIRTAGLACADFDRAIRSDADASRLDRRYAAPDDTHPNVDGQRRLAQEMIETIARLSL